MKKTNNTKTNNTLNNTLNKKEYNTILNNMVNKFNDEDVIINLKSNRQVFNEGLEIFKPNEKDLKDKNHKHYNPNTLLNVFMKHSTFNTYKVNELKLPIKIETLKEDGFRYWLCITNIEDFKKLFKHLIKNGYKFNNIEG